MQLKFQYRSQRFSFLVLYLPRVFTEQDTVVNELAIAPSLLQGSVRNSLCNIQAYLRFWKREKIRRFTGYMISSQFNLSHCMWSILSEQRDL